MLKKRQLIIIVLFLLALSSGLLLFYMEQPSKSAVIVDHSLPDSYANNVTLTRYDDQGNIVSQIYSPHLTHFKQDNRTLFEKPHIILYNKGQNPWVIDAAEGLATHEFEKITLVKDVTAHQAASAQNNEITITTSEMNIDTKNQTAYSKQPIQLIQKGQDKSLTIVNSVGVYVEQKTGIVKLLTQAKGYYAPATK